MFVIFKKDFFFLKIILVYFCYSLLIAGTITSSDTYYYGKDLSENQACAKALNNAKNKAASSLGEFISSDSIMLCNETNVEENCKQFSNIWTESIGIVKILNEPKKEAGYDKLKASYFCKQTITAEVTQSGKPDPNFDFKVSLNKNVFQIDTKNKNEDTYKAKIDLVIDIFPLSNMYVYIFYYSPSGSINIYNEKIKRIFPNLLCKKNLKVKEKKNYNYIEENTKIPYSICHQKFELMYSKSDYLDKKNKQEHLLVIATKYKINFNDEYSIKSLQSKINEIKKSDIRRKSISVNAFFN